MLSQKLGLSLGALALASLASCTVTIDFSPLGSDVSLNGAWTIGGNPADAASCAAAGISTVQLVFVDGALQYRFPTTLAWPCSAGAFDTRPSAVLDHGRYVVFWEGLDSAGRQLQFSEQFVVDVSSFSAVHATLPTAAFVAGTVFDPRGTDASLGASWTINGGAPDAAACAAAGISQIAFILYADTDTARVNGVEVARSQCAGGSYDSRPTNILRMGSYLTRIRALDGSGASVADYDSPSPFVVSAPMHYNLMAVDFVVSTTPSLSVNFAWDTTPGPTMTDSDCAGAGVVTMSYMLTPMAGGPNVDEDFGIPCADNLTWDDMAPGTYRLFVEGFIAGGVKQWESMACDMYIVESGLEEYNCFMNNTL